MTTPPLVSEPSTLRLNFLGIETSSEAKPVKSLPSLKHIASLGTNLLGTSQRSNLTSELEADYRLWLRTLYPRTYQAELAPYHQEYWAWLQGIERSHYAVRPYVTVWPRGWAKSTNGEVSATYLGPVKGLRYLLYVCDTQARADDHVSNIGRRLEGAEFARHYPHYSERAVNKYGASLGWRRNRLTTRAGYTIDALGLDTVIRGIKLDDDRPDGIILDDVDQREDTTEIVARKIRALQNDILPATAANPVVQVLQNLVHGNGIVAQLVDGRAEYLGGRIVSGPHPAIVGLETEGRGIDAVITAGEPTWAYYGLEHCQALIARVGLQAFLAECQHEVALSGQPRFSLEALKLQARQEPLPAKALPVEYQRIAGLRVYSLPVAGVPYVLYTDPAEGKGRDYCATGILDVRTRALVCVLEDNDRNPQEHADLACDLWLWYRCTVGGYERAKGEAIAGVWGQRGVGRVYQHEDNPLTPQQRQLGIEPKLRPGYPMTNHTKRGLIDRLAGLLDTRGIIVPDSRTLDQCARYVVTERNTTEAAPGEHDDLVLMLAGLALLAEEPGAQSVGGTIRARNYAGMR